MPSFKRLRKEKRIETINANGGLTRKSKVVKMDLSVLHLTPGRQAEEKWVKIIVFRV